MNTNWEYYKIFYYVVHYGSFTKAGRALGSNQPNVTRAINKLESELQTRLVVRSHHGITLTEDGQKFYQHIEKAMKQITEGEALLNHPQRSRHITIAVTPIAMKLHVFHFLTIFHRQYPDISLNILNMNTAQAIKAAENNQADLAIVTSPLNETTLNSAPLMRFADILIGGPQKKEWSMASHQLKDFQNIPFIGINTESMTHIYLTKIFNRHHLHYHTAIEVSSVDQIVPFVKADFGLAFIPEPIVRSDIKKGDLFQIPLHDILPQRSIVLISGSTLSPEAKHFRSELLTYKKRK